MYESYAVRIPPVGFAGVHAVPPDGPSFSECIDWVQGFFEPVRVTNLAVLRSLRTVYAGHLIALVNDGAARSPELNLRATAVITDPFNVRLIYGPIVFLGQHGAELIGLPEPLADRLASWANRHPNGL